MNINARIDWRDGMPLSARTFVELDEQIARRQQVASRAINGDQFGLIPYTEFSCQGGFVRNKLEIERLSCMALLPSGRILHVDEKVVIPIPLVYGEEYYLACGIGETRTGFDVKNVPFVRPEHTFGIYQLNELEGTDLFPVMKFKVNNGEFAIDEEYIPPCLHLSSNERFMAYVASVSDLVGQLAGHANLETGEGKRAFQRYAYSLQHYDRRERVAQLTRLLREVAQAVDFYVVAPYAEAAGGVRPYSPYDIAAWLAWLENHLRGAVATLDKVVLEDRGIDLEALKAQIMAELHERLAKELYERLYKELREKLYGELKERLSRELTDYLNGKLKDDLHDALAGELSPELYDKLYKALYESLYNALYVPKEVEEEEEEFMPLI